MGDSDVLVAAAELLMTELGDEVVILDLRDGVYYSLEAAGARIWSLLQRPVTVPRLRDAIAAEFDVDPAVCEQDIRVLVRTLAAHRLIEIRRPGEARGDGR
jgi:hypothetical protein